MMKKNIYIAFISFIVGGVLSFLVSRVSMQHKIESTSVYGETYEGAVSNIQLNPLKEEGSDKPILPMKQIEIQYRDTGNTESITETRYIYQIVDTAAIIADYVLKRSYDVIAFDDMDKGKLRLFPVIQYNKLDAIDYEFTPVYRQTSVYKEKVWQPFISGSYSTLDIIGLGGGIFYHNIGFEYQYQIDYENIRKGYSFGLKYKF